MPRTPAGGRLPHGPRHVLAVLNPAVVAVAVLAGVCGCAVPDEAQTAVAGPPSGTTTRTPTATGPARTSSGAASAAPSRPASTPGAEAGTGGGRRTPVRRVRGTVVRVSVESDAASGTPGAGGKQRDGEIATWLQTPSGRVKVRTSTLTSAPTGSTVDADIADPAPTAAAPSGGSAVAAAESGAEVVAARVASTPPEPALRAAVHDVTVVLATPAGTSPDGTTPAQLAAAVNGPVSRYWSGQTAGRVRWRVARSVGWLRLRSRCDDPWALWAEAAQRSGFIPARDRHLLVLVPATASACYAGLGTIGASSDAGGYAYVRGTLTGLVAHELGHNLGLGHSNGLQCDGHADGTWTGTRWTNGCVRTGYRDWYDVMGVSWEHLGTLSTAQAWRLGALPAAQVATVSAPGRATLTAVGAGTGLRSLRVAAPGGGTYVVEYRAAVGTDAWLADDWRGLRPGVLVRRDDPQDDPAQTLLLDASPSQAAQFADDWDEPVPAGGSLTTATGRIVLRVGAVTATTAQVEVDVDGVRPAGLVTRVPGRSADGTNRVVRLAPVGTPASTTSPSPSTPFTSASPSSAPSDAPPTSGRLTRRTLRTPSR